MELSKIFPQELSTVGRWWIHQLSVDSIMALIGNYNHWSSFRVDQFISLQRSFISMELHYKTGVKHQSIEKKLDIKWYEWIVRRNLIVVKAIHGLKRLMYTAVSTHEEVCTTACRHQEKTENADRQLPPLAEDSEIGHPRWKWINHCSGKWRTCSNLQEIYRLEIKWHSISISQGYTPAIQCEERLLGW